MIAGRPPFDGATPLELVRMHMKEPLRPLQSVVSSTPRGVSFTIDRMMAKDPDQRIQTAEDLCQVIEEQCIGPRDVVGELGLGERKRPESLWDVKLSVGNRVEKRRLSVADMRERIRKKQITAETPVRRAGTRDEYQPAGSFRELEREFPRDYAVRAAATQVSEPSSTHSKLHDLMTHYDEASRAHRRKKALKGALPILIKLAVLLVVAGVIWAYRTPIWDFISGLIGGGGEAP
jgi:serine/threonine protein kinase